MMRPRRAASRRRRRGFTLTEMVIASFLAALLGILMGIACATFARPALAVEARARITQEGILAAQSIACDLGGFLGDSAGRTGTLSQYQFVDWDLSQGNVMLLNFQGTSPGNIIVITYQLQGNLLVRTDTSTGVSTTIAKYVTAFAVEQDPNNANQALIQITIAFRYFQATFSLIGVSPT
jgi:Tfp pilus assembly protein PilE